MKFGSIINNNEKTDLDTFVRCKNGRYEFEDNSKFIIISNIDEFKSKYLTFINDSNKIPVVLYRDLNDFNKLFQFGKSKLGTVFLNKGYILINKKLDEEELSKIFTLIKKYSFEGVAFFHDLNGVEKENFRKIYDSINAADPFEEILDILDGYAEGCDCEETAFHFEE